MADNARIELARLHLQAHREWVQRPPEETIDLSYHEVMADAILANPDVVVRALIAAGHASLSLIDGTPVYLIEVEAK